jgi:hypothetical protein
MSAQIKIKRLKSQDAGFKEALLSSLSLPMADDEAIDASVAKILLTVKESGDLAVLDFTKQFDRLNVASVSELEIPKKDLEQAFHWYSIAAKAGNVIAQHNLGAAYAKGSGTKVDYIEAQLWYLKAASKGSRGGSQCCQSLWRPSGAKGARAGRGRRSSRATYRIILLKKLRHFFPEFLELLCGSYSRARTHNPIDKEFRKSIESMFV